VLAWEREREPEREPGLVRGQALVPEHRDVHPLAQRELAWEQALVRALVPVRERVLVRALVPVRERVLARVLVPVRERVLARVRVPVGAQERHGVHLQGWLVQGPAGRVWEQVSSLQEEPDHALLRSFVMKRVFGRALHER